MTVSFVDVRAAAERIRGQVVRTPCLRSDTLSAITGAKLLWGTTDRPRHRDEEEDSDDDDDDVDDVDDDSDQPEDAR